MERRQVVMGGLVGLTSLAAVPEASVGGAAAGETDSLVAGAIVDLRRSLEERQAQPWQGIARVREAQRTFLRSAHHYPEFLEVGVGVWDAVHDWHASFQRPLTMSRLDDGRYVMAFTFTTLILRPDLAPDYVSDGYDGARTRLTP